MEGNNIFTVKYKLPKEEIFETILTNKNIKIEKIISYGQITEKGKWYDQDEDEWVILLKGKAILKLKGENKLINMIAGDFISIKAHVKNRVEYTSDDAIWLAVHY
jgi:cupin 2 domain-containing protein